MATKTTIDPVNFNAWRKSINPKATDYVFKGNDKDNAVLDWANKNGYDNSKNYIGTSAPKAPQYNYGLATQGENDYIQKNAPTDTYLSRFSSMYPAPKEITPQQEQNQRNVASVAESLKSLAEIYGQAKGAHLQARVPEENAKAEQQILYNRNKYDEDLRNYQRAYISAAGQDSENLRQLREKALGYGKMIADNDYASQKLAYEKALKENDIAAANAFKEKMQKAEHKWKSGENQKRMNFDRENKRNASSSNVNIQDSSGVTYDIPYRDWNIKAQDIYSKMKANGLPALITTIKDPSDPAGLRVMKVEDKNSNNIRAYVEQNLQNQKYMTPDLWNEVHSLSTKTPYSSKPQTSKPQAQQPVKINW
jgi:hypothetical protein